VRLGVNIGYWGLGLLAEGHLAVAREAERLGFDSIWAGEAYGSDAATVLGFLAADTGNIGLGAAVMQVPARSPAMTAMTAATLDRLSGGRFRLGLGASGPQVAEGWHGQAFDRPVARLRDYVAIVRMALARERLIHQGTAISVPVSDQPAKALKLMISPVQRHLPVYLAALRPQTLALTGEVADGWLPAFLSAEHMPYSLRAIEEGAARAGRDLHGFDIAPTISLWIDDDREAARDRLRYSIALYAGGMGSKEHNYYADLVRDYGFEGAADNIQALFLSGHKREATAAVPEKLIDMLTLCGPAGHVRERLAAYEEAGATTVLLSPAVSQLDAYLRQLRLASELWA
jgi:F420-dependent oxidoreductase-like protein